MFSITVILIITITTIPLIYLVEEAVPLSILDHPQGDPILHGAPSIEELALCNCFN